MLARVELKGTWSRSDTTRSDVNYYRKHMRARVSENGGWFDARCPRAQESEGAMSGTFHVELPITNAYASDRQRITAAKRVFEALMALTMCRAPKVKYTDAEVYITFRADAESPILV